MIRSDKILSDLKVGALGALGVLGVKIQTIPRRKLPISHVGALGGRLGALGPGMGFSNAKFDSRLLSALFLPRSWSLP